MRLALLVLCLAASLEASTILPGSWIEAWIGHGGLGRSMELSLQAEDGFFIEGGGDAGLSLFDGIVYLAWEAGSSNAWVTAVSEPWRPGDGLSVAADGAHFFMTAPETPLANGTAPFTFYGYLDASGQPQGSPIWPLIYEFSGQGTAYFNTQGEADYIYSARYEFDVITNPEPATWALMALGLGFVWWKRRQLSFKAD